jgi:serine/threonine protein phosphatase 1
MSKWRPEDNCLYVIPDIHGMAGELELILNRILPLRNSGGHRDVLVFLGDYVDRRADSHRVLDLVMEVKEDFPDQVFCLCGNHELMFLEALSPNQTLAQYNMWMHNGGESTMVGYLTRDGSEVDDPYMIPRMNISRFIPQEHQEFLKSLLSYHETEDYIFVHGGCDPFVPLEAQRKEVLAWDRSVYNQMSNIAENKWLCPWEKTIVTGHNGEEDGSPFIWDKYMMLDGSYAGKLYVWELNSRTGFSARNNKKRLVREPII